MAHRTLDSTQVRRARRIARFPATFAVGSVEPRVNASRLDAFLDALSTCRGPVELVGFTSNTGARASNTRLGLQRARGVALFLQRQGLDNTEFIARSRGQESPVGDNAHAAGRRRNRRVVAVCGVDRGSKLYRGREEQ